MKVIGIDLGTTYSAVAVIEDGEPRIIPTAEGERICPSVVALSKSGERLVGQMARRQAAANPENTVFSIKRLMGRRADDAEVAQARRHWPYRILGGPAGDARVYLPQSGRTYTPQELAAMVLRKLKEDAEAYLGERVTQAVITVPAYFNDSQRQATRDAGRIAGLEVLRIVNEPTAASLAYGLHGRGMETIMVFDLGGGTFDVSILEVGEGMVEVRATSGDTFLGGDDWDRRIVDHVLARFTHEQGVDLRRDDHALRRLLEAAEKAKIELSTVSETEINLPFITADLGGPRHLHTPLTRARLEGLTADLVQRCVAPVERALRDAGLAAADLDQVVLIGGATRMPMIQDLVRRLTGREPSRSRSPDELVAIGAAVQAGVLAGEVRDVLLLDVTALTLGVETAEGRMAPLIERNTTIPVRKSELLSTAEDGQTAVTVHVLQGEEPLAADNTSLGRFHLEGIPPAPRGVPQIEVTFDIDANGILSVSARDNATGSRQAITVSASTSLGQVEMERMVREARQREAEDRRRQELAQARNDADVAVYEVERVLRELGARVPAADRSRIERTIGELQVVKEGGSTLRIRQLIEYLQQARYALGRQGAAQQEPHPARGQDAAGGGPPTA